MKTINLLFLVLAVSLLNVAGFSMSGAGENYPTVQSALGGLYYVRTIPKENFGSAGKTQVFRVGANGDELINEYPVYMRGDLFLGWSPIAGKYCLVHVEPERIKTNNDFQKFGKVSRLAFYMGGKELSAYTNQDLEKMGLKEETQRLHQPGQFIVRAIEQFLNTNDYVLKIEKATTHGKDSEILLLDITTGKIFHDDSDKSKKAEQDAAANP